MYCEFYNLHVCAVMFCADCHSGSFEVVLYVEYGSFDIWMAGVAYLVISRSISYLLPRTSFLLHTGLLSNYLLILSCGLHDLLRIECAGYVGIFWTLQLILNSLNSLELFEEAGEHLCCFEKEKIRPNFAYILLVMDFSVARSTVTLILLRFCDSVRCVSFPFSFLRLLLSYLLQFIVLNFLMFWRYYVGLVIWRRWRRRPRW